MVYGRRKNMREKVGYNLIVNFSKKYDYIANYFILLLNKNLLSLGYNFKIFVCVDEVIDLPIDFQNVYVSNEPLPVKIRQIAINNPSDYYICLLGDAFICEKVNVEKLNYFFEEVLNERMSYCNLIPKSKINRKRIYQIIKANRRYSVSFIAFLASYNFIISEFGGITDYDFENKYLLKGLNSKEKFLENMYIVTNNIFNIYHGISNGKWIRKTYRKLKSNGINIDRRIVFQNPLDIFREFLFRVSNILFPLKFRYVIKKLLRHLGFKFKSDY